MILKIKKCITCVFTANENDPSFKDRNNKIVKACITCRNKKKLEVNSRNDKKNETLKPGEKKCTGCKFIGPNDHEFFKNEKGVVLKTCKTCLAKRKQNKEKRKTKLIEKNQKKCERCPFVANIGDVEFINELGIETDICSVCRPKKHISDSEYKKRKIDDDEIGFKEHSAKLSNITYHKNMQNEEYRKKRQCYSAESRKRRPEQIKAYTKLRNASDKIKIEKYIYNCNIQQKNWLLSDTDALDLFGKPCFYCNEIDPRGYGGIDRIDSENPNYLLNLCVPCCAMCNYMKKSWSQSSFVALCGHIATYNNLDGGPLIPDMILDRINSPYTGYQKNAKEKGLIFNITKTEYNTIIKNNCYICGKSPSSTHKNGIDRLDSNKGYIMNNCKACCANCNYLKDRYALELFLNKCSKIYLNCHEKVTKQEGNIIKTKII